MNLYISIIKNESLQKYMVNDGIIWKFNPPSALHFGILCDADLKSVKSYLHKTIGNSLFTLEFSILLLPVEASLNWRPLCPLSNDPNNLQVIYQVIFDRCFFDSYSRVSCF